MSYEKVFTTSTLTPILTNLPLWMKESIEKSWSKSGIIAPYHSSTLLRWAKDVPKSWRFAFTRRVSRTINCTRSSRLIVPQNLMSGWRNLASDWRSGATTFKSTSPVSPSPSFSCRTSTFLVVFCKQLYRIKSYIHIFVSYIIGAVRMYSKYTYT